MPKLLDWCDEPLVAHWEQAHAILPNEAEVLERMMTRGRLSKVRYPSVQHPATQIAPAASLRIVQHLRPAR
jgi:hypothetical protein